MPALALPLLNGSHAATRRRRRPSCLAVLCCTAVFFFVVAQLRLLRGWSDPAPRALADQRARPADDVWAPPPPPPPPPEEVDGRAKVDIPEATVSPPSAAVSTHDNAAAKADGPPAPVNVKDRPATSAPTDSRRRAFTQSAPIANANKAAADGRLHDWVWHLNLYLEQYGVTPLHVWQRSGPIFGKLTTRPLPQVHTGPLVTVIMVAFNAEDTVEYAVNSILHQTWRSLELVIVDDASEDRTWSMLTDLGKRDARIRLVRNAVQVGPYISRNRVLNTAAGAFVTTQDADDWSLPGRIEAQVRDMVDSQGRVRANMVRMLRMQPSGVVSTAIASSFAPDGVARQAFVSAMYDARLLREDLGYWDSVWYGADGEMIRRAQTLLGAGFHEIDTVGVFLADRPNSLGKQGYLANPALHREPSHGWAGSTRAVYRTAYDAWHAKAQEDGKALYLPFPLHRRLFTAPPKMVVEIEHVCAGLRVTKSACEGQEERESTSM